MIDRCYNIKNKFYKYYGGRSINVCERWRNSINNFIEDMGERPPNHELDRIDTDGNYDISNCRWVTHAQNMKNTRTAKKYREKYLFKTIKISNLCKQCLDQVNND